MLCVSYKSSAGHAVLIQRNLYVGNRAASTDEAFLASKGYNNLKMCLINFLIILYGFTEIKYIINVADKVKAKTQPEFVEKGGIFYLNTGFADRQDTKALLETYLFLKDKLKLIFEKEKAVLIHCDQGRNRCRKSFLFFLMVFRSVVYVIKSLFFSNVFQICGNLSYVCIGVYELVFVRCIPSPEGNSVFTTSGCLHK